MNMKWHGFIIALMIVTLLSPMCVYCQPMWGEASDKAMVKLEWIKPFMRSWSDGSKSYEYSLMSSAAYLSGQVPASDLFLFRIEFSASMVRIDEVDNFSGYHGTGDLKGDFGSIFLGMETGGNQWPLVVELAVRIPIDSLKQGATYGLGRIADISRLEAFLPNTRTFSLGILKHHNLSRHLIVTGRLRFSLIDFVYIDNDPFKLLHYSPQLRYQENGHTIYGGFVGYHWFDEKLGVRSSNNVRLGASYRFGQIRPGLHIDLPIDKGLGDQTGFILGLNLSIDFR